MHYLPNGTIKNYTIITNWKKFCGKPITSDIKWYEQIRKLTTEQEEDYNKGCLLDYYQIKNHYGSLIADLIKQKEINADPKAIQQIEFVRQLKNSDGINAGGDDAQSILV